MSVSRFVADHLTSLALGGAVAVSLYVLVGPASFGAKKRPGGIPGLVNTGNTCFVNSVLQVSLELGTSLNTIRDGSERSRHFHNHGEGPYQGPY